jgi:IclR family transcriptional regulator, pca regulon regulatory protein
MEDERERHYVQSLERGLAVIQSFGESRDRQTIADVAEATGLTRAAARRFILTLVDLGYLRADGRYFAMTPKILELGYSYLTSAPLSATVLPHLTNLISTVRESTPLSILDAGLTVLHGSEIVYVAHARAENLFMLNVSTGTRFPAWITSTGRVLLSSLSDQELDEHLKGVELTKYTDMTVSSKAQLRKSIREISVRGWAVLDQEFDERLCAYAVPVYDRSQHPVAALNLSVMHTSSHPEEFEAALISAMTNTAARVEADLRLRRGPNDLAQSV